MSTEELSIANPEPAASPEPETTQVEGAELEAGTEEETKEQKAEKTPEQREIERLRRGLDRKTRQREEARAEAALLRDQLTRGVKNPNNHDTDDSEPLTLTKAELAEFVKAEAAKLAPTIQSEKAESERRQGVITSLEKTWGKERFDEVSSDLDEAFGGLTDRSGRPKPAIEAVFEADEPAKVIEWLADPDNVDEAERISKMGAVQAGRAIAKLELQLSAESQKSKPRASKVPAPLESIRGGGVNAEPDESKMTDVQWAKHQEAKRNKR